MHVAYHRKKLNCGIFTSAERPQQNKTSPSPFPVLILPTFHSANRCEGRQCIVLGLCNASLLSSLSQFVLLLLLFVPQYGRLAAILKLLAFNHSAYLRNARRISYPTTTRGIFTSLEQTTFNISKTLQYLSFFPSFLTCIIGCVCEEGRITTDIYRVRLKIGVRSLLHRMEKCQPATASCFHVFVPQYGRLAAILITGV